jgi:hypothetical protein
LLRNVTQGLGLGWIIWNGLGEGKWTLGKLEIKILLETPRRRWEDNIKMGLKI